MNSSKYFQEHELACHCGCGTGSMDPELLALADRLREQFGSSLSANSAFRCQKHNDAEGGAKSSQHLLGRAMDISWGSMPGADKQKLLALAIPLFRGIGLHPQFLHVDNRLGPEALFFYPS